MVPEHIRSPEEAKEILRRYNIQKKQLPKIKVTDPIAKEIGARVGDVIKIIRRSQTAGESVSYRITVR